MRNSQAVTSPNPSTQAQDTQAEAIKTILTVMEEQEAIDRELAHRTSATLVKSGARISSVFRRTYDACKSEKAL